MDKPKKKRPGEGDRERRPSKYGGEGGRAVGGQARRAAFKKIIPQAKKTPGIKDVPEPGAQPDFLIEEAKAVGKEPPKNSAFNKLKLLQASINSRKSVTQNASPGTGSQDPISPDILEELFPKIGEKERPIQSREERKKRTKKQVERRPILRIATETEDDGLEENAPPEEHSLHGQHSGRWNDSREIKSNLREENPLSVLRHEEEINGSDTEHPTEGTQLATSDGNGDLYRYSDRGSARSGGRFEGDASELSVEMGEQIDRTESGARDFEEDKVNEREASSGSINRLGKLARGSSYGGDRTFRGDRGGLSGIEEGTGINNSYVHFAQEGEVNGRFTSLHSVTEGMGEDAQGEVNAEEGDGHATVHAYDSTEDENKEGGLANCAGVVGKKDRSKKASVELGYEGVPERIRQETRASDKRSRGIDALEEELSQEHVESDTREASEGVASRVYSANSGRQNSKDKERKDRASTKTRDVGDVNGPERLCANAQEDAEVVDGTEYDSSYDGDGARGSGEGSVSNPIVEEESLSGGEGSTLRKNNSRGRTNRQGRNQRGHTTGERRDREGTVRDEELSTEDESLGQDPSSRNLTLVSKASKGLGAVQSTSSALSTVSQSGLKAPEKKHLPIFSQSSPVRDSITPYSPSVLAGVAALLDLPGAICDNCPLGEDKCPKFQLGANCYYEENMEALPVRDRESFLPLMEHFAQIDVKRATRAVMIEQRATGQVANDPAVTRLIEKAQRSLKELEEIKTPVRAQAERSITVIAKESGSPAPAQGSNLIQALMSSLSPPKSLPPAQQESDIITIEPEHVSTLTDD